MDYGTCPLTYSIANIMSARITRLLITCRSRVLDGEFQRGYGIKRRARIIRRGASPRRRFRNKRLEQYTSPSGADTTSRLTQWSLRAGQEE